jgi:DegV family protein with EDD domain
MSPTLFYEKVRNGQGSTTTLINSQHFSDVFTTILEKGMDILYIAFSSALSGTYQSSLLARSELVERFPDRQITVVDSLCASLGQGLLIFQAVQRRNQGWTLEALTAWLEENKQHVVHWFTVDDLNHLRRGGRVSATAALLGTILSIKPVLHVNDQGKLIPVEKVKSRKRALRSLVDRMGETVIEPMQQTVFISHGDSLADAEAVAAMVKERFQVKDVIINYVGPVIGSHSGPGTIALFYMGKTRSPEH